MSREPEKMLYILWGVCSFVGELREGTLSVFTAGKRGYEHQVLIVSMNGALPEFNYTPVLFF
jgi:hypothetical protein